MGAQIRSAQAIDLYLHRSENKRLWCASRYGDKKAKEMYAYLMHTKLPTFRDALWYSDGTKLNYYYRDDKGKMRADLWVYEIMDAATECMLGYAIGNIEDFVLQYHAAKMAIQFSQAKPYEWHYDIVYNRDDHCYISYHIDVHWDKYSLVY